MTEEIQLRFEQAAECVEDAQVLLDHDRLAAAVTRAYYAMFHAATAVLLARGIKRSSHRGMLSAFGEHVVKPGAIDRTFFQHLRDAFERRQQSDYEPMIEIDRNTVVQKAPECGRLHRRLPQTRQLTTDNCLLTTKLTKPTKTSARNYQRTTNNLFPTDYRLPTTGFSHAETAKPAEVSR